MKRRIAITVVAIAAVFTVFCVYAKNYPNRDNQNDEKEIIIDDSPIEDETEEEPESNNDPIEQYAGTYVACDIYNSWYGGGKELEPLIINTDGSVSGGTASWASDYPDNAPISVELKDDGTIWSQIDYVDEEMQNYYIIYPQGVKGDTPFDKGSENEDMRKMLMDNIYVEYVQLDGGVLDIIYYKSE